MLGKVFDRFVEKSPISVMVRGTLERVLDGPEAVYPHRVVFYGLRHPQSGRLSDQALGTRSVSGAGRHGRCLAHLGLQQAQWGRDAYFGGVGPL